MDEVFATEQRAVIEELPETEDADGWMAIEHQDMDDDVEREDTLAAAMLTYGSDVDIDDEDMEEDDDEEDEDMDDDDEGEEGEGEKVKRRRRK